MKRYSILIGVSLFSFLLSGCMQILNEPVGAEKEKMENSVQADENSYYELTYADMNTECENTVEIDLDKDKNISSKKYTFEKDCLTIREPGDYKLSGKLTNGNIVINVYDDENVHLILDSVELQSAIGPAIYVEDAGKVIITLPEGTQSIIEDSAENEAGMEASIFSNVDLTFNGKGILYVYGYFHDALRSKDCLKVIDTTLLVKSKNNGIRGNDGVLLLNSTVEIESEGIGIKSESDKDYVIIEGGSCKIIAGENAVLSGKYVSIKNCETDLYSVEESIKCNGVKEIDE